MFPLCLVYVKFEIVSISFFSLIILGTFYNLWTVSLLLTVKWGGQEAPTKAEDTDHSGRRSQEDPKRGREDGAAGFTHLAMFLWLTVLGVERKQRDLRAQEGRVGPKVRARARGATVRGQAGLRDGLPAPGRPQLRKSPGPGREDSAPEK